MKTTSKKRAPKLSPAEAAQRDARMQYFLNLMRMAKVYRSCVAARTFYAPADELAQHIEAGIMTIDHGHTLTFVYDDGLYDVADFDQATDEVTLLKRHSA